MLRPFLIFALVFSIHLNLSAQVANTPEAAAKIQALAQQLNPSVIREMYALYTEILQNAPRDGVDVIRDLRYGEYERQRLDVHRSASRAVGLPVLVFVHGGGFVRGDKNMSDVIHGNIATYFARHGVVGVNATYRLAPKHQWPSGVEDMAAIITWLRSHVDEYGGDPERIYLMGHSAGAAHVAAYTFFEGFQVDQGNDGVKGAILLSGVYKPRPGGPELVYYGEDPQSLSQGNILSKIDGRKIPLFLIDSEFDPGFMQQGTVELMAAVCKRDNKCPRRLHVQGHNHISEAIHLNSADESVGPALLDFINGGR